MLTGGSVRRVGLLRVIGSVLALVLLLGGLVAVEVIMGGGFRPEPFAKLAAIVLVVLSVPVGARAGVLLGATCLAMWRTLFGDGTSLHAVLHDVVLLAAAVTRSVVAVVGPSLMAGWVLSAAGLPSASDVEAAFMFDSVAFVVSFVLGIPYDATGGCSDSAFWDVRRPRDLSCLFLGGFLVTSWSLFDRCIMIYSYIYRGESPDPPPASRVGAGGCNGGGGRRRWGRDGLVSSESLSSEGFGHFWIAVASLWVDNVLVGHQPTPRLGKVDVAQSDRVAVS